MFANFKSGLIFGISTGRMYILFSSFSSIKFCFVVLINCYIGLPQCGHFGGLPEVQGICIPHHTQVVNTTPLIFNRFNVFILYILFTLLIVTYYNQNVNRTNCELFVNMFILVREGSL